MGRKGVNQSSPWLLKDRIKLYEQYAPSPSLDGFPVVSGGDIPKAQRATSFKTHNRMPAQHGPVPRRFSPRSTWNESKTTPAFGSTTPRNSSLSSSLTSTGRSMGNTFQGTPGSASKPVKPARTRAARRKRKGVSPRTTRVPPKEFPPRHVENMRTNENLVDYDDDTTSVGTPGRSQAPALHPGGSGAEDMTDTGGDVHRDSPQHGILSVEVSAQPTTVRDPSRTEVLARPKSAAAVVVPEHRGAAGNIMIRRRSAGPKSGRRSAPGTPRRPENAAPDSLDQLDIPEQKFLLDTLGHVSQAGPDQKVTVTQYKEAIKENTEYLTRIFQAKLREQRALLGGTDFEARRKYKEELSSMERQYNARVNEWSTKFKALKQEQSQWKKLAEEIKQVKRENEQLTRHFKAVISDMEEKNEHLTQKVDELRITDNDKVGLARKLQEEMASLQAELRAKDLKLAQMRDAARLAESKANESDAQMLGDLDELRDLLSERDAQLAAKQQNLLDLRSEIDALERRNRAAEDAAAQALADAEKARREAAEASNRPTQAITLPVSASAPVTDTSVVPSASSSAAPTRDSGARTAQSPIPSRAMTAVAEPVAATTRTTPSPTAIAVETVSAAPSAAAAIASSQGAVSPESRGSPRTSVESGTRSRVTSAGSAVGLRGDDLKRASAPNPSRAPGSPVGLRRDSKPRSAKKKKELAREREAERQRLNDDMIREFHAKIQALKKKSQEELEERNTDLKRQMYRIHDMVEAMKKAMTVTLDVDDSLQVDLTCQKCFKLMNDPVSLPCGHTFCRNCVETTKLNDEFVFCNVCDNTQETLTIPNSVADDIVSRYSARQISLQNVIEIMFKLTGVVEAVAGLSGDHLDRDSADRINAEQDRIKEKLQTADLEDNHTPETARAVKEHSRPASQASTAATAADFAATDLMVSHGPGEVLIPSQQT